MIYWISMDPTCDGGNGITRPLAVSISQILKQWPLISVYGLSALAAGLAFLLIVYASFIIMTSQGVPQKTQGRTGTSGVGHYGARHVDFWGCHLEIYRR